MANHYGIETLKSDAEQFVARASRYLTEKTPESELAYQITRDHFFKNAKPILSQQPQLLDELLVFENLELEQNDASMQAFDFNFHANTPSPKQVVILDLDDFFSPIVEAKAALDRNDPVRMHHNRLPAEPDAQAQADMDHLEMMMLRGQLKPRMSM